MLLNVTINFHKWESYCDTFPEQGRCQEADSLTLRRPYQQRSINYNGALNSSKRLHRR